MSGGRRGAHAPDLLPYPQGPDSGVRPLLARGSAANVLGELGGTAEMVVVGSRERGGVAGLKLGSVAWQVAVHGHGPVVVVRGQWHVAGHAPGPVAVGVGGSPASQAAIAFAFGEAALHGVPLLAVCALADAPGMLGGAREMEADFSHAMTVRERALRCHGAAAGRARRAADRSAGRRGRRIALRDASAWPAPPSAWFGDPGHAHMSKVRL